MDAMHVGKPPGSTLKAGERLAYAAAFPAVSAWPGPGQGPTCPGGMSKIIQDRQDMGGMSSVLL